MTIRVLAFGVVREIFDNISIEIKLDSGFDVRRLKSALEERFPRLQKLGSYMIAVNKEYAGDELQLSEQDEVAIIPPVSGG
jgi:molybdopterin converting factor subunit 1